MDHTRAIIDIGSNTVRLVIFGGPRRAPTVLFNEKVSAKLGRGLAETGMLSDKAMKAAPERWRAIEHCCGSRASTMSIRSPRPRRAMRATGPSSSARSVPLVSSPACYRASKKPSRRRTG
jgi:hypothetical protein